MNMLEIGVLLKLSDQMTGGLRGVQGGLDQLGNKFDQLAQKAEHFGRQSIANGLILMGAMRKPIEAFADLDDASTNLRVAMMDNLGRVPPQFAEINKQAVELGNLLPGTTADFTNAATALLENGTAINAVIGGGLKSASYLSVILKMNASDAAEMVAKFREAYGLTQDELVKMADLTQKAKFAFGLTPEEIKYAAQYMGASLNSLHLTGTANAKLMLAFQGYARQQSMDGSIFGTNFAQMLNQIGQLENKLTRTSKPIKEVNSELAKYGIQMQFFDKAGKFMGIENMVGQLQKLRVLSEQERLFVTNRLFGMEGGRVAGVAIKMGSEGLQHQLALMDKQADLMQRIDTVTKSAKNTWEAFTGTVTNLMAAFAGPAVQSLEPYINKLNEITGGPLQRFVEEHKTLAKVIGTVAIGLGASAVAIGGVALAIGTLARARSVLGGTKGAAGAAGGLLGGMKLPLPVYVVNGRMSLPDNMMGGTPELPGAGNSAGKGASRLAKIGSLASKAIGLYAAWETGQAIGDMFGSFLYNHSSDKQHMDSGRQTAKLLAFFGNADAKAALDAERKYNQQLNGTIHIKIDQDGRASVTGVNSSAPGMKFNAYAGHTMVTP
jgi:TP901 family phage tail tape measure protein